MAARTGPCQTNHLAKQAPAIPEICPSGEEPPEVTPETDPTGEEPPKAPPRAPPHRTNPMRDGPTLIGQGSAKSCMCLGDPPGRLCVVPAPTAKSFWALAQKPPVVLAAIPSTWRSL